MKEEKVNNVYFATYKLLPIGFNKGLIFYQPNKTSISKILKENTTLKSYLNELKSNKGAVIYDNYFKTVGTLKFMFYLYWYGII
jgi:hypothetical protein